MLPPLEIVADAVVSYHAQAFFSIFEGRAIHDVPAAISGMRPLLAPLPGGPAS